MERGIKENTHPGEILKEEVINANNLSVTEAAHLLKVTRPTLSRVLNCHAAISPEMALRIAMVFGGNPGLWLRLQTSYDLREAERSFRENHIQLEKYELA